MSAGGGLPFHSPSYNAPSRGQEERHHAQEAWSFPPDVDYYDGSAPQLYNPPIVATLSASTCFATHADAECRQREVPCYGPHVDIWNVCAS